MKQPLAVGARGCSQTELAKGADLMEPILYLPVQAVALPDARPLAYVLEGVEPELWALEALPDETPEEEAGRKEAAADILDELLAEVAGEHVAVTSAPARHLELVTGTGGPSEDELRYVIEQARLVVERGCWPDGWPDPVEILSDLLECDGVAS